LIQDGHCVWWEPCRQGLGFKIDGFVHDETMKVGFFLKFLNKLEQRRCWDLTPMLKLANLF
jgi:hypothetical protein